MTVATLTDDKIARERVTNERRGAGLLTVATGIASLVLLAFHPGGGATDFAGVLREEAANRGQDALVHGGFIVVLALQAVCYSLLSARIGWQRVAPIAGFIFFCVGAAFLSASMVIDGLVTPAVAAHYVGAPAAIESARVLFVLFGALIGILMPIGLGFQATAIAIWGSALTATGYRLTGAVGLIVGLATLAALAVDFTPLNPLVLMGAIAGSALWAVSVGVMMIRRHD